MNLGFKAGRNVLYPFTQLIALVIWFVGTFLVSVCFGYLLQVFPEPWGIIEQPGAIPVFWMLIFSMAVAVGIDYKQGEEEHAQQLSTLAVWKQRLQGDETAGGTSTQIMLDLFTVATLHAGLGQFKESADVYARAVEIMRKEVGSDHPELRRVLLQYAQVLEASGNAIEAKRISEQARTIPTLEA
jgi:hypothetical protein